MEQSAESLLLAIHHELSQRDPVPSPTLDVTREAGRDTQPASASLGTGKYVRHFEDAYHIIATIDALPLLPGGLTVSSFAARFGWTARFGEAMMPTIARPSSRTRTQGRISRDPTPPLLDGTGAYAFLSRTLVPSFGGDSRARCHSRVTD